MMLKKNLRGLFALYLGLSFGLTDLVNAAESVPPLINYQGSLTDANGAPMAGVKTMEFNLYDAPTGGNLIWGPQIYATVPLIGGKFNVLLGPTDGGGKLITTAFADKTRYLSITIEGKEILPRQQILSTPFAMQAQEATEAKHAKEADHAALADGSKANFSVPASGTLSSPGRLHISGEEHLVLLNKTGVTVSKAWGGNGNLTVEGNLFFPKGHHNCSWVGVPAGVEYGGGNAFCPPGAYVAGMNQKYHGGNFRNWIDAMLCCYVAP